MTELVETFKTIDGCELRIIATLTSLDRQMIYVRDDLESEFREADLDRAHRDLIANQLSADDFKENVGGSEVNCQTFLFDEKIAFLFPSSRYDSVFVSFEYQQPFPFQAVIDSGGTIPHLS